MIYEGIAFDMLYWYGQLIWTPAFRGLFVCVCIRVSVDMSPYCSSHDEWLIMKLCMYVGYHTANNVSNFGGDPVTQLFYKFNLSFFFSPYCSARDEWLIMKLCMYVGYHTANNVSNFGGDPVTQLNLKFYKFNLSFFFSPYCSARDEWLIMKLCMYVGYHTANDVSNFGSDPIKFKKKL